MSYVLSFADFSASTNLRPISLVVSGVSSVLFAPCARYSVRQPFCNSLPRMLRTSMGDAVRACGELEGDDGGSGRCCRSSTLSVAPARARARLQLSTPSAIEVPRDERSLCATAYANLPAVFVSLGRGVRYLVYRLARLCAFHLAPSWTFRCRMRVGIKANQVRANRSWLGEMRCLLRLDALRTLNAPPLLA